jgi:hypothetical protein
MTMSDLAVLTVRRLCEDGQMGEPDERPLTEWAEFADMTEDDFWDYMAGLPSTFLTDGGEYLLDYQNNFILQAEGKGPNYRFDDEVQMNRFLTYHEAKEDMEVDAERHVYVSKREPAVKPIPMEQKREHVVHEYGPYVFLKLPLDPDFIQREGIDMQHCLAVAHHDYCNRMRSGQIEVYSLTDTRDGLPKVDIEVALTKPSYNVAVDQPTVTQIRGPRNELPPKDEFLPALMDFFEKFGGPRGWRLTDHGVRNFDGRTDGDVMLARWKQIQGG